MNASISLSTLTISAVNLATSLIEKRYGLDVDPDQSLPFHGTGHTRGVIRRAEVLIRAMGGSSRDVCLARIAAAFHDTVQQWEENPGQNGRIMRRRFVGRNEAASAEEAVAWMRSQNGLFTEADELLVTDAILATVPGWDPVAGTVFQPNLAAGSHIVVRAVAMADLGVAGMEGEVFLGQGDTLFREENLDIARAIRGAETRDDISTDRQEGYRQRMIEWNRSQANYARGRRIRLEQELGTLGDDLKDSVRALFIAFDAAISAAENLVMEREQLSFWDVAKAMGYDIPCA